MDRTARRKATDYALALAEKQKMRYYYGLMEKQFRGIYEKAIRRRGVTGEIMLQILETRLDSVVHNLGFGYTRAQARQMVTHGHVLVNGKRARTPSIALHEGDKVEIKHSEKSRHLADKNLEYSTSRTIPEWLELDKAAYTGSVTGCPRARTSSPWQTSRPSLSFIPVNPSCSGGPRNQQLYGPQICGNEVCGQIKIATKVRKKCQNV